MRLNYIFILSVLIFASVSYSCQKNQAEEDREIIENYINEHKLNAVEYNSTGLFYIIEKEGSAKHPDVNSSITINYKGELTSGSVFDSNKGVTFKLSNLIRGWQLGIPLIGEGGKIKLIIPSGLAYGSRATGTIPSNSVLIFEIDLLLFN